MIEITKEQFKEEISGITIRRFDKEPGDCSREEIFEAVTEYASDRVLEVKAKASKRHQDEPKKKVYYFSMEFLIGPILDNYLMNLGIREEVAEGLSDMGFDIEDIIAMDYDPGLGNGGLGRLAACFLDSMASLGIQGVGMGLRYDFGLFKQKIENGYQTEVPDPWLAKGYPWGVPVPSDITEIRFGGRIERSFRDGKLSFRHVDFESVNALPYIVPILGYGADECNSLHLYSAEPSMELLDFDAFNKGDYAKAFARQSEAKAITSVLYPNDGTEAGRKLRLKQEYFLVCAGMQSVFRTYKKRYAGEPWSSFPDHVAIQINDTHPTMIIPELMRRLMDDEGLEWDEAWDITTKTVAFTNHTVMPEALEKWPQSMMESLLPRIYMIIEEIDRRWKAKLAGREDFASVHKATAVLWGGEARMANLAIIGSHSVNGVAKIHSDILTGELFREFYAMNPEKFSNKTNGVSQRRFLIQSNPALATLITETIGYGWKRDFSEIEKLGEYLDDRQVLEQLYWVKRQNKLRLAKYIEEKEHITVDPDSIFDVHVKRIHGYKRQLLTAFKVLNLYNKLKENPELPMRPVTFIVSGKAAPGYDFAKECIKFICSIADKVNSDPVISQKMKLVFIENFSLSNAQLIYPAADISEQISTAGKEASGTGCMKLMMNGAVTLGTLDGANIEIRDHVGEENIRIFGIGADEAESLHQSGSYRPDEIIAASPELLRLTSQLVDGFFEDSGSEFWGIYDSLVNHGDEFFVLKDFDSYYKAWTGLVSLYGDRQGWERLSLANIAGSGFFSSDRTIREYAKEVWNL